MIVDLSHVPDGWFVERLTHNHTPIKYAGERHVPWSHFGSEKVWTCKLQCWSGGRLTEGHGETPAAALAAANAAVAEGYRVGRWS